MMMNSDFTCTQPWTLFMWFNNTLTDLLPSSEPCVEFEQCTFQGVLVSLDVLYHL